VEAAASRAEPVADDAGQRPGQNERRAVRGSAQRIERLPPRDAVGAETRVALEPSEGAFRARPELAVDRPARETMLRERELESDDVRPRQPQPERARPERAQPQRAARERPDDAVRRERRASLRPNDGGVCRRAADTVDRAGVQPAGPEGALERGDGRIARAACRRRCDQREQRHGKRLRPHPASFDAAAPVPGLRRPRPAG
jgi:hypothetical protein